MPNPTADKNQPKKSQSPRGGDMEDDQERDRMADEGGMAPDPDDDLEIDIEDDDGDEDEHDRITQRNPSVDDVDDKPPRH